MQMSPSAADPDLDEARHAAVEARDARFDGVFFTGVTSTGIYCRCVCPARLPKRANRRFFPSAAAAERAGFRPCLLCRPEAAPGVAPIDRGDRLAGLALAEIEAGALEDRGLENLAARHGVTGRHLRRVMLEAFGASPIELAQTHRLLTAKRLLHETDLGMTQVAFAAGFKSLRRFNALFQDRYGMTPSRIRARRGEAGRGEVRVNLAARGRWAPKPMFAFLAQRALTGVERVEGLVYVRTLALRGGAGIVRVAATSRGVDMTVSDDLAPHLRLIIAKARRAFDLDADTDAIDGVLARAGGALAADVAARPGVRIPGAFDAFEIVARAVLGQQVTQPAGRLLAERLAHAFGARRAGAPAGLDLLFPNAAAIAACDPRDIAALGMPGRRAAALVSAAAAFDKLPTVAALDNAGGVGPWTRAYVRLRAFGDPDAFPPADAALARAGAAISDFAIAPWRGYAAIRLWTAGAVRGDAR